MKMVNRSESAKKAWETIRKKYSQEELHRIYSNAAKKAGKTKRNKQLEPKFILSSKNKKNRISTGDPARRAWITIRESEKEFVKQNSFLEENLLIHGAGFPDFTHYGNGKFSFYEIKPKIGSSKSTKLNEKQKNTIHKILGWGMGNVYLVKYVKKEGEYIYETTPVTLDNLNNV